MTDALIAMPKYEAYKESGLGWFREIPEHWKLERGKWLFHKSDRSVRETDEVVTCFRDGQVTLRINRRTEGFTNAIQEHGYQGIRIGDLVIHAMDAFAGAIGVSDSDGKSTPVYSACVPRNTNSVDVFYYAYLMRDLALSGFIESLAKGIRERSTDFRFNDFANLELVIPPLSEQTAIAKFLDRKTTQIDQAISIKEKQIALLKERKQILIQSAVTRGLDPNVPMKDAGVDWIGEIPEHWEVKRLASFGSFSKGGGFSKSDLTDNGTSAILYGDIYTQYEFSINNTVRNISPEVADNSIIIRRNDLLFTGSGETKEDIGKCVVYDSSEMAVAGGDIIIFRQNENNTLFLTYSLNSHGIVGEKAKSSKGEIIVHTYASKLKNLYIPIPPSEEQENIVTHINTELSKIEKAIELQQLQINKLKEYKSTLINSAVTGKIKVA